MRALVVEDDKSVREATTMLLHCAGIEACAVATGEEAIDLEPKGAFDVVLLDVGLPGIDGFEVCRRVRRVSQTPIVVLTARTGIEDLVTALELGADDYVVKPFRAAELLARVHAVVRRHHRDTTSGTIRVGDLEIDAAAFTARHRGVPCDLTATEFRLLLELVRHCGQVLTRQQLLERVWRYDYIGDSRLVDMAVKRLRDKLGDDPRHPRFVTTVRGVGYRFERPAAETNPGGQTIGNIRFRETVHHTTRRPSRSSVPQ